MRLTLSTTILINALTLALPVLAEESTPVAEFPDITDIEIPMDAPTVAPASQIPWPQFTIAYQAGSTVSMSPEVASNRFDMRAQWSKLFAGNVFAQADAKIIVRTLGDDAREDNRRTDAKYRIRELFVQAGGEKFGVKAGVQPIVWGELDAVSVLDVLTPWDYSEFAFTSPDEARVGQLWIALDAYAGGKWSFLLGPAPQTTRYPKGNVNGLVATALGVSDFELHTQTPKMFSDSEYGVKWKHSIGGSDVALMAANIVGDDPMFAVRPNSSPLIFDVSYPSYQLIGASTNYVAGRFLWKAESSYKFDLNVLGAAGTTDVFDAAGGFEYNANGAYTLQVEASNRYIIDSTIRAPGDKRSLSQLAARWSKNFFNDTLSAIYYVSYQIQYEDTIHSLGLHYAWTDRLAFDINATIFSINNSTSPMRFADDWDQAVVKVSYAL